MPKILIVEDDEQLSRSLTLCFEEPRFVVDLAHTVATAREKLDFFDYDCVIMDWNLPDGEGIDLLRDFRERGGKTPVLMLTGKSTIDDKLSGFKSGSDDYLTKPFHLKELQVRIEALLRRQRDSDLAVLTAGFLSLDVGELKLTVDGQEVKLLPKELALLEFFMRNPNKVFSPAGLLSKVWSSDSESSPETVVTTIKRLRKKIDRPGQESLVQNVFGVGYKFIPPMES